LNEVLSEAGYQEHELRWELAELKRRKGQLALFELAAPEPQTPQRASIEEIAEQIRILFKGKTIIKKDIYRSLVDESYSRNEIDKALTYLKRQKLAFFGVDQRINTPITIK
jgi:hypothetical protein